MATVKKSAGKPAAKRTTRKNTPPAKAPQAGDQKPPTADQQTPAPADQQLAAADQQTPAPADQQLAAADQQTPAPADQQLAAADQQTPAIDHLPVEPITQEPPAGDPPQAPANPAYEAPENTVNEPAPSQDIEEEPVSGFKARNPMTGMFTLEERELIEIHLQARIAAGVTRDASHFVRQCVNFCINYTPGWQFGRADVPRKNFE